MDLAALYAFAEREALSRLCDVLEEVNIERIRYRKPANSIPLDR